MRASIAMGRVACVAALALSGVWATVTTAQASAGDAITAVHDAPVETLGSTPDPEPLTVLLMGDSYTAGNGAREGSDPSYYGPERCMRSTNTWGEQYANSLENQGYAVTLLNRACSAATSDAVLHDRFMKDSQVVTYPEPEDETAPLGDESYASWAASTPQCTPAAASEEYFVTRVLRTPRGDGSSDVSVQCDRWLAPQVDSLNRDVDLVLLTLGGNDAHFPDIVQSCLILGDAKGCDGAVETARDYVNDGYTEDLIDVFTEIERRTDGHAKVIYLAYPGLEVNDDLRITQLDSSGISTYQVSAQLSALEAAGVKAQRVAVDAINASFGQGTVTFIDEVPSLFAGHEPNALPDVANPDRWMYEFLETTTRDEWYHLKPEGQRQIAQLVADNGAFGAVDDNGRARDVALVVGDNTAARDAATAALEDDSLWSGAQITVVEQRVADDGFHLLRRVVASKGNPADALAALRSGDRPEWVAASEVSLSSRWNATAQAVYVGEATFASGDVADVWAGDADGNEVAVDTRVVTFTATEDAPERVGLAQSAVRDRLVEALASAGDVPHAWAGGPYVASGNNLELIASGSVGAGQLTYTWDLDGDGVYETKADGPHLSVEAGKIEPGWVALRVAVPGGGTSVAWAWVASASDAVTETIPCVGQDGAVAERGSSGRLGCGASPTLHVGPDADAEVPSPTPVYEHGGAVGSASGEAALAALTLVPIFVDDRLATVGGNRSVVTSRAHSRARKRPRQLVMRERGLAALLDRSVVR